MATRLQQTIFDANQQDWTILIDDADFSGSATDIDITAAKIQWQASSSERFAAVMPSVADVSFRIDGAFLQTFVTDYIAAAEQRFKLVVYKGIDLFWVGNIQTDNVRRQDKEWPYIFQIRAACGLSLLKDIDYNDGGTEYTGVQTIAKHLTNALTKIGTSSFLSPFLAASINWYSDQHTTSTDVFEDVAFDHRRFVSVDSTGTKSYRSCFDVVESICETFGARIAMTNGCFRIIQINEFEGANFGFLEYNATGAASGSTTATSYRLTDGTDVTRLGGGAFQYYPALDRVEVRYTHFQAQSIIPPDSVNSTAFTVDNVDSGGGTSTILFRTQYEATTTFTGAFVNQHRIKFILQIKVGSQYLKRPATMSANGSIYYAPGEWTTTLSYVEYFTNPIVEQTATTFTTTNTITSPPIPANGQLSVLGNYIDTVGPDGQSLDPLTFNSTISFFNSYLEIVPEGALSSRENEVLYPANNDDTNNSKKVVVNTELGDGPSFNALGALRVNNATQKAGGWAKGATGTTTPIGKLLANEIMLTQAKPVQIISAAYIGSISPINTVYFDTVDYAVRQVSLDMVSGKTQGLFFECDSTGAVLIEKDPEPVFNPDSDPISPITPITDIVKNPNAESEIDPTLQTTFAKRRVFTTDGAISEGATVTSIQIAASGIDDLIKTNDSFDIIDAITGNSQTFVATADVAGTDTSITVTSDTADFDFSGGSIISYSQRQLMTRLETSTSGWDNSSINLEFVDTDMSSTVVTTTYKNKRHFVITGTVTGSATSDTLIILPTASETYQNHQFWIAASDDNSTYSVKITSGGVIKELIDGQLVSVKCMQFQGAWFWVTTSTDNYWALP